jgi:hypothetical protein
MESKTRRSFAAGVLNNTCGNLQTRVRLANAMTTTMTTAAPIAQTPSALMLAPTGRER